MKTITPQSLEIIIGNIVDDKEKQAKVLGVPFIGVADKEVMDEVGKRIGTNWVLKKEQPFKLTKDDINVIANSRYYQKSGIKLLMFLVIVMLGLAILTVTFRILPNYIYYALNLISAVVFVFTYSRKQKAFRAELWKGIDGDTEVK